MTEAELIKAHDDLNPWNKSEPASYYVDELRRREAARAEEASYALARRTLWFTIATAILALGSLAVAVVAIYVAVHLAH
jgi:cell division septal protein FtsQ